eukprot:6046052-Prymnesium_polylepis.2
MTGRALTDLLRHCTPLRGSGDLSRHVSSRWLHLSLRVATVLASVCRVHGVDAGTLPSTSEEVRSTADGPNEVVPACFPSKLPSLLLSSLLRELRDVRNVKSVFLVERSRTNLDVKALRPAREELICFAELSHPRCVVQGHEQLTAEKCTAPQTQSPELNPSASHLHDLPVAHAQLLEVHQKLAKTLCREHALVLLCDAPDHLCDAFAAPVDTHARFKAVGEVDFGSKALAAAVRRWAMLA